mmetsp:Transcript_11382/g.30370  ORF Transcript_11382/g.30370 Transcript_11382/m.30370 type:complete len:559 (+) Transcript_11382:1413-3089(+)
MVPRTQQEVDRRAQEAVGWIAHVAGLLLQAAGRSAEELLRVEGGVHNGLDRPLYQDAHPPHCHRHPAGARLPRDLPLHGAFGSEGREEEIDHGLLLRCRCMGSRGRQLVEPPGGIPAGVVRLGPKREPRPGDQTQFHRAVGAVQGRPQHQGETVRPETGRVCPLLLRRSDRILLLGRVRQHRLVDRVLFREPRHAGLCRALAADRVLLFALRGALPLHDRVGEPQAPVQLLRQLSVEALPPEHGEPLHGLLLPGHQAEGESWKLPPDGVPRRLAKADHEHLVHPHRRLYRKEHRGALHRAIQDLARGAPGQAAPRGGSAAGPALLGRDAVQAARVSAGEAGSERRRAGGRARLPHPLRLDRARHRALLPALLRHPPADARQGLDPAVPTSPAAEAVRHRREGLHHQGPDARGGSVLGDHAGAVQPSLRRVGPPREAQQRRRVHCPDGGRRRRRRPAGPQGVHGREGPGRPPAVRGAGDHAAQRRPRGLGPQPVGAAREPLGAGAAVADLGAGGVGRRSAVPIGLDADGVKKASTHPGAASSREPGRGSSRAACGRGRR